MVCDPRNIHYLLLVRRGFGNFSIFSLSVLRPRGGHLSKVRGGGDAKQQSFLTQERKFVLILW